MTELRTRQYDDGRWCEQEYLGDKLNGRWTVFYANGGKEWERLHEKDRKEGYFKRWDRAGRLIEEMWFHLDQLHGRWRKWDKDEAEEIVGDFYFGYPRPAFDSTRNTEFNTLIKPFYGLEPAEFAATIEDFLCRLRRPSLRMRKASANESLDLLKRGSFWNHVNVLGAGERWPQFRGEPLFPMLQINCDEITLSDNPLTEFSFVTLFAVAGTAAQNLGEDIVVRAYRRDELLVPTDLPCEPLGQPCGLVLSDSVDSFPDENDLPPGMVAFLRDENSYEQVLIQDDKLLSRLGGWPGWLQSGRLSAFDRFAIQADSLDIENWDCGDCTIHYFFRDAKTGGFSWVQEMC
jgi:hypothetical protein